MVIDPRTREQLRQLSERNMPHTATLQSRTNVDLGGGASRVDWADGVVTRCRVAPASVTPEVVGEGVRVERAWVVVVPRDVVGIEALKTRLVIDVEGRTLTVLVRGVLAPRTNGFQQRLLTEEV